MLGVLVSVHWDWRAIPLALALFLLIRPLAVWLLMPRRYPDRGQCLTVGWFGIRGIGSLYYLSYAVTHGLLPDETEVIISVTSVVALSILIHGSAPSRCCGATNAAVARRLPATVETASRAADWPAAGRLQAGQLLARRKPTFMVTEMPDLAVLDMAADFADLEPPRRSAAIWRPRRYRSESPRRRCYARNRRFQPSCRCDDPT